MIKRRKRRSGDAGAVRLRGLLFFVAAMLPEFISALSVEDARINWPLVCCKAALSGCVALGGFLDQTISRLREKVINRDSSSNTSAQGSAAG